MNQIKDAFTDMWSNMVLFLPSIIQALLLFLVAWIVAVVVKKLVLKLLMKINLDKKLAKGKKPSDPEYGKERVRNIAQILYFLVFLLFLPSILDALSMESVSAPISNMMNNLLGFIPHLIGAGIIVFIGYFIAKVVRDLTYMFLQTVNIDKWYNKIIADKETKSLDQTKKNTLADILSKVVFGLVLIPVATLALETLNIKTLTEPIVMVLNKVMEMIPNVLVAVLLVVLGYYIANFVSKLLEDLLSRMGINKVFGFLENNVSQDMPRFNLSKIIGSIVKVLIILFITVESLSILKLNVLNTIGYSIIGYLPLIVSGLIIIGIGLLAGYFVESIINKYTKSPFTAAIAKYIIIIFSVFMTLEQIKFASTIVNIAFLLVLGGLSVAFAIAFGVGGRDFASRQLKKFEDKVEKENKKPVPENNPIDKMNKSVKKDS